MCVNDILSHGAEPLFFLDYFANGRLNVELAQEIIRGIAVGCTQANCALVGKDPYHSPRLSYSPEKDCWRFTSGSILLIVTFSKSL